jgi:hypothetical protein
MQTLATVWLRERDWNTGQTGLDEPGSDAGVEQSHNQYGERWGGDWKAEEGTCVRIPAGKGFRDESEADGLPLGEAPHPTSRT